MRWFVGQGVVVDEWAEVGGLLVGGGCVVWCELVGGV
jgi:hypothetical protein